MEGQWKHIDATCKCQKQGGNTHFDSSGHTFILDKDTGEAFYLAPSNSLSPAHTTAAPEFAGLATDNISPAFLASQPAHDMLEYEALLVMESDLKASVDWRECTQPNVDVAAISVSPIHG
jgi:hypothetical protein